MDGMGGGGLVLIVMRHAKAGELPGGPDAERALRPQGQRDAAAAGAWLRGRGRQPDAVLCSPARRARQTWQYVSAELGVPVPASVDPRLYDASAGQLADIIRATAPEVSTLMCVGHNPAAAELATALTGTEVSLPAAAVAVIGVPAPWARLRDGSGVLTESWRPPPTPS
jgi:phosphohistidine phosphatase